MSGAASSLLRSVLATLAIAGAFACAVSSAGTTALGPSSNLLVWAHFRVFPVTPDGNALSPLVGGTCLVTGLSWAPDHSRAYMGCADVSEFGVVVYDGPADPAKPTDLDALRVVLRSADWWAISPDGRRIAFSRSQRVYVAASDGSHPRMLAGHFPSGAPVSVGWSPDGSHVLVGTCRVRSPYGCTRGLLMTVPVNGGRLEQLLEVRDNAAVIAPDSSAKANKIVFTVQHTSTKFKLAVVGADGKGYRELTTFDDGISYSPRWSPDGSRIAFIGKRKGKPKSVYVITPSGRPVGTISVFGPYLVDW